MQSAEEVETAVRQCFGYLQTTDNALLQQATDWLGEFITNQYSIQVLLNIYSNSQDNTERNYAAVFLKCALQSIWGQIDPDTQTRYFTSFLSVAAKESEWVIKQYMVFVIQNAMKDDYFSIVYPFIQENCLESDNASLVELGLMLAPLLKIENDLSEEYRSFFLRLLEKGLFSEIPELRIAAFNVMLFIPKLRDYPEFQEKIQLYWDQAVEIFSTQTKSINLVERLAKLFTYAMHEHYFKFDTRSLLENCLAFFTDDNTPVQFYLVIADVIHSVCCAYPTIFFDCGILLQLFQFYLLICAKLYEPDDELIITTSNFFANTFTEICKTPESLQLLWEFCISNLDSLPGNFYAVCSFGATFSNYPSFYLDKLSALTELLCSCLSCQSSQLLRDASAKTTNSFISYYGRDCEYTPNLVEVVLDACMQNVTPDLLLVFTALLDTTKNSEDIFDRALPFLYHVVLEGSTDLQVAALPAIASLASGSTVKIAVNFNEIYQLIYTILVSTAENCELLKSPAVECLTHVASVTKDLFSDKVVDFCNFCIENLENEDSGLAIACYIGLEEMSQDFPKDFTPVIDIIMPVMCEKASTDFSPIYTSAYKQNLDNGEFDPIFGLPIDQIPQFVTSAMALRIISSIVKNNRNICPNYVLLIMHCCEIHKQSVATICKLAAAYAVGNLAEAIVSFVNSFPSISTRLGHVLLAILPEKKSEDSCEEDPPLTDDDAQLTIDGFVAAAKIVEWLDYDSLHNTLKPLLDVAKYLLKKISSEHSYSIYTRDIIENIYSFLYMIIISAENIAPQLLHEFMNMFVEFSNHEDVRFRSLAARFFGDIISVAPNDEEQTIDDEFKQTALEFAVNLANQESDVNAFSCIKAFGKKEPQLAIQFADQVYQICIEKLNLPLIKTETFLLMRDHCVGAFVTYAMNVFKDRLNLSECLSPLLAALPLVLDFSEQDQVAEFLIWAYQQVDQQYYSLFLSPLIMLFGNPPNIMVQLQLSDNLRNQLLDILKGLLQMTENSSQTILEVLNNDTNRASFVEAYISN